MQVKICGVFYFLFLFPPIKFEDATVNTPSQGWVQTYTISQCTNLSQGWVQTYIK